jgi:hypothetical protein
VSAFDSRLVIHVGYPKTATTTFQQYVFPQHPEIEYLGKFIPTFRYVEDRLYGLIDELLHRSTIRFRGSEELQSLIRPLCAQTDRNCVLLSSESFIHPSTIDAGTVADRLYDAFGPCKILITIREQISAILSFYWMHGRYGQYLTIGSKVEEDRISYPIPFSDWLRFQKTALDQNYLGTLHYDSVIGYYTEKFGSDNVGVFLYEAFKADPDNYAASLGSFLGVNVPTLCSLMADKHELRSSGRQAPWDKGQVSAIEALSKPARIVDLFSRLFGSHRIESRSNGPIEEEVVALQEAFRAGNARLARDRSLPLGQFGYSV